MDVLSLGLLDVAAAFAEVAAAGGAGVRRAREARLAALARVTGGRYLAERRVVTTTTAAVASELALRFARIARICDDKAAGQATTLAELRRLYERQFRTKGRVV